MAPTACKRTVSGSISLPCPGCFSPFPHGTCTLSVSQEYLALADGAARFRQDSSGPALLRVPLRLDKISGTRLSRSPAGLSRPLPYPVFDDIAALQPRNCRNRPGLGSSAFAHHYSRNNFCSLLLRVLRCFSSPRSPRSAVTPKRVPGSPIRKSADQWIFAPPRGLSQLVTSFLASESHRHPPRALVHFLVLFSHMSSFLYQYVYDLFCFQWKLSGE